jgi:hypothetical protein
MRVVVPETVYQFVVKPTENYSRSVMDSLNNTQYLFGCEYNCKSGAIG